jgi:hypothetical protein
LADLHKVARLYVNFFQPSFKLKSKTREGCKVIKKYHPPATPYEQLLADERVDSGVKQRLREQFASLDPLALLSQLRQAQEEIARLETGADTEPVQRFWNSITSFAASKPLGATARFALHTGNAAPMPSLTPGAHVPIRTKRSGRLLQQWLNEEPHATAKGLFRRLNTEMPNRFKPGQYRTLQRRVGEPQLLEIGEPQLRRRALVLGCNYDNHRGCTQIAKAKGRFPTFPRVNDSHSRTQNKSLWLPVVETTTTTSVTFFPEATRVAE